MTALRVFQLRMKRLWILMILLWAAAAGLAVTKNLWLPEDFREAWHRSWLASEDFQSGPSAEMVSQHEVELKKIETEYQEKIDREKKLNEIYRIEYERLLKEKS